MAKKTATTTNKASEGFKEEVESFEKAKENIKSGDGKSSLFAIDPMLSANVNEKDYAKKNMVIKHNGTIPEIATQQLPIKVLDINDTSDDTADLFDDDKKKKGKDKPEVEDDRAMLGDDFLPPPPTRHRSQSSTSQREPSRRMPSGDDDIYNGGDGGDGGNRVSEVDDFVVNPSFKQQTPKEQKKGAEKFAKMLLSAYTFLNEMLSKFMSISEEQLIDIAVKQGIPLDILNQPIPIGGSSMSIRQYFDDYNAECKDAFEVDKEFKEDIWDDLVSICVSKGWGLTAEQSLLFSIVKKTGSAFVNCVVNKYQFNAIVGSVGQAFRDLQGEGDGSDLISHINSSQPPSSNAEQVFVQQQQNVATFHQSDSQINETIYEEIASQGKSKKNKGSDDDDDDDMSTSLEPEESKFKEGNSAVPMLIVN